MTLIGYMMCEQTGPKQPERDVALAEQAGFYFAVSSDHYFLRLEAHRLPVAGGTSPAALATCRIAPRDARGGRRDHQGAAGGWRDDSRLN